MTEKEAKEIINNFPNWNLDDQWLEESKMCDLCETVKSALSELQQYRSIGTVEEFSGALKNVKTLSRMYEKLNNQEVSEYHKLNQYEEIGTIEEFREAVERQKEKRPIDDTEFGMCPHCHNEFNSELVNEYNMKHCLYCGQAILWENDAK